MASILMTWELGGGWGHLMRMLPIARGLVARGHRVWLALRDLSRANQLFGPDVRLLQSPMRTRMISDEIGVPTTLAHILHNNTFNDENELIGLCRGWDSVFELARPDLMICDHSPTALLAARGKKFRTCIIGTGFICPPDEQPLPNLRFWAPADSAQLLRDEMRVLEKANMALAARQSLPLARVGELYGQVGSAFLMTYRELDHYPNRGACEYWGDAVELDGDEPRWPDGQGPRVFGYLKNHGKTLEALEELGRLPFRSLIYMERLDAAAREKLTTHQLTLTDRRQNLARAGRECDLAILNATHGSTMAMLLAGKPTLQVPIYLEQMLLAQSVRRMGAGLVVNMQQPQEMVGCLRRMAESPSFAQAAGQFAAKYAGADPAARKLEMLDRIEALAGV